MFKMIDSQNFNIKLWIFLYTYIWSQLIEISLRFRSFRSKQALQYVLDLSVVDITDQFLDHFVVR